jgi:phosphoribosylglycinamide formyltransferase-1
MKNIAIFASGSGSNAENIIRYFDASDAVKVALVLSNNKNAGVLERAARMDVPYFVFSRKAFEEATEILDKLREYEVAFVVLAGFMNKISQPLLDAFPNRIINIHPALLPKYGGKGMYGMNVHQAVTAAGEKQSGITIHYINEHYDEGAIIFQATCPVYSEDTPEALAARVHELEYAFYPKVIEKTLSAL